MIFSDKEMSFLVLRHLRGLNAWLLLLRPAGSDAEIPKSLANAMRVIPSASQEWDVLDNVFVKLFLALDRTVQMAPNTWKCYTELLGLIFRYDE